MIRGASTAVLVLILGALVFAAAHERFGLRLPDTFGAVPQDGPPRVLPQARQSNSCHSREQITLPDADCTPGAVMDTGAQRLCDEPVYEPRLDKETQARVHAAYGTAPAQATIDLLIPAGLGGSSARANLYPLAHSQRERKSQLEKQLYRALCDGERELHDIQQALASQWTTARR